MRAGLISAPEWLLEARATEFDGDIGPLLARNASGRRRGPVDLDSQGPTTPATSSAG